MLVSCLHHEKGEKFFICPEICLGICTDPPNSNDAPMEWFDFTTMTFQGFT